MKKGSCFRNEERTRTAYSLLLYCQNDQTVLVILLFTKQHNFTININEFSINYASLRLTQSRKTCLSWLKHVVNIFYSFPFFIKYLIIGILLSSGLKDKLKKNMSVSSLILIFPFRTTRHKFSAWFKRRSNPKTNEGSTDSPELSLPHHAPILIVHSVLTMPNK